MVENVDEGNKNDFKENDNDRIKLGKCFKNLSEEEKAKFRMVSSDIAWNENKEDDFVKGTQKAMETRCAPKRFAKLSINLSPRDFEYIMGIKDGGVDIDVDLGIDDINKLRNEYCDDSGYIKLKTLELKLVNQRESSCKIAHCSSFSGKRRSDICNKRLADFKQKWRLASGRKRHTDMCDKRLADIIQ
ncbi:hypothetical protein WN944_002119 [Citrus x changshan-huyou]|uniref:Uncharacterized protein n=1 Tax=Citrus x changshan-huyou TaxID=2935761 RepID=A0AAP0MM96_9ROSI